MTRLATRRPPFALPSPGLRSDEPAPTRGPLAPPPAALPAGRALPDASTAEQPLQFVILDAPRGP